MHFNKLLRIVAALAVYTLFCLPLITGCGTGGEEVAGQREKRSLLPTSHGQTLNTNEFDVVQISEEQSIEPDPSPPTAASSSDQCSEFVEGSPVGLACIHCGHPNAQAQALRLADIMARSCRRNLATTMLIDGTFSDNRDTLGEIVRTLTSRGSRLHLFLYLSNGPWQRRYQTSAAKGVGTTISPEEFRSRIMNDPGLQAQYQGRVQWALPLVNYAQSRGSIVYLIPMLEDNLNQEAARKMEALTLEVVPPSLHVAIGRNPCVGCYPGNEGTIPPGIFQDQHIRSMYEPVHPTGGLVTNDGTSVSFPHEPNASSRLFSVEELQDIISQALGKNNSFVIWRRNYQGLSEGGGLPDPDYRNFPMPTPADEQVLLGLLQTR